MSDNTWTYEKEVSGFVTVHNGKDMLSLAIADAKCGEDGKVIAVFGECGGVFEDETIHDLR